MHTTNYFLLPDEVRLYISNFMDKETKSNMSLLNHDCYEFDRRTRYVKVVKNIMDNQLDEIFNRYSDLQQLSLGGCKSITNKSFCFISRLKNLRDLDLRDSIMMHLSHLSALTNLIKLNLWGCKMNDQTFSPIFQFNNLRDLNVGYCEITNTSHLSKLTNLTMLNLWGSKMINDQGFSSISLLTNLRGLDISYCKIKNISRLSGLTNLTMLNLYDCFCITKIEFSSISLLTNLRDLNASYCNIKNASHLSGLTNLTRLILWCCKIINNQQALSSFFRLTNLRELNVNNYYGKSIKAFHLLGLTNLTSLA